MIIKQKKIVVIGGGTGTFVVLSGLKKYFEDLVAIVSMADSGGSNRIIRDEFGLLPTSDIRQCFVALASGNNETEKIMRNLFIYRFCKGSGALNGMTFGNLFMAALADILGSQYEAIKKTGKVLRITGRVIPVTLTKVNLVAEYEDGRIIRGEHEIDEPSSETRKKIIKLWLEPAAYATPEAIREIKKADLIILAPGDLYTSLLANLIVGGIAAALRKAKGKILYILNLMTKAGQTAGFKASDHLKEIIKYLGRKPDMVIINNKKIPAFVEKYYWRKEKSVRVEDDLEKNPEIKVIRADVLSDKIYKKPASDILERSLIRHDSFKLAKLIHSFFS